MLQITADQQSMPIHTLQRERGPRKDQSSGTRSYDDPFRSVLQDPFMILDQSPFPGGHRQLRCGGDYLLRQFKAFRQIVQELLMLFQAIHLLIRIKLSGRT